VNLCDIIVPSFDENKAATGRFSKIMFETTIMWVAWIGVVIVQAVVHFWILDSRKRLDDDEVPSPTHPVNEVNNNDNAEISSKSNQHEEKASDFDQVPRMVPHIPGAEDEDDDEQESFDGDEPQVFFELLEQTGSEMIKVSCKVSADSRS
jgi:hypothetical protein